MESQGSLKTSPCSSKWFNWLRLQDQCQYLEWNPHFAKLKAFHIRYTTGSTAFVYAYKDIKMMSEILELNPDVDHSHP